MSWLRLNGLGADTEMGFCTSSEGFVLHANGTMTRADCEGMLRNVQNGSVFPTPPVPVSQPVNGQLAPASGESRMDRSRRMIEMVKALRAQASAPAPMQPAPPVSVSRTTVVKTPVPPPQPEKTDWMREVILGVAIGVTTAVALSYLPKGRRS